MRRMALLALAILVAFIASAWVIGGSYAQRQTDWRSIGVVAPGFSAESEESQAFREGLRAAGYVEGRDVSIDWWFGHGNYDGVTDAVAKLVWSKVDVIVVESTVAALAAKNATKSIPIVMALVGDPVGVGLINNLGHPGGNITGLTNMTSQLMTKRLQLLKEAVPSVKRVGVLWNPDTPLHRASLVSLKSVAPELRLKLVLVPVHQAEQLGPAFATLIRSRVGAVMALDDPFMASNGRTVLELANRYRLPLALGWKRLAKEGVLISYGTQFTELFRRAAGYVDKILKGANPGSLPVEQPTKFELVVNLKDGQSTWTHDSRTCAIAGG